MDCVFFCLNCIEAVRGSRHEETGPNYRRRVGQAGKKSLNKSHFQTQTFRFFFISFFVGWMQWECGLYSVNDGGWWRWWSRVLMVLLRKKKTSPQSQRWQFIHFSEVTHPAQTLKTLTLRIDGPKCSPQSLL